MANRFHPESELAMINRLASDYPLSISEELWDIIEECIEYHQKTFGAFDITIQSSGNFRKGIEHILLDRAKRTIFLQNGNIQLDLSGYIKGYALDRVKELLTASACRDALISMGNSSVLAMGNHPMGHGWKVSTQYNGVLTEANKEVTLYDEFLTTSGNETEERKHLIDPTTGQYITGARVASVITKSGSLGEVLSKTLLISPKIKEKLLNNFSFSYL